MEAEGQGPTPFRMHTAFRKDIEGLRALAVALVVLYHAGLGMVSGGYVGVDVFFVISGYLITGLLVRELDATGTIQLINFYSKRARRLLPASFAVLVVVASVIYITPRWIPDLIAPQLYGRSISWDIQRSSLYIVNWLFAERSVDYQGGTELASPVQHFWSLSVEEQFYAVWPLLLLGITVLSRSSKKVLALCLFGITLASLAMSYRLTLYVPERAYFVTTTRVWEMSLGGLAALAAPLINQGLRTKTWQPKRVAFGASVLSGAGLLAVGVAAVLFDSATAFPGLAALLPTVGTAVALLALPHSTSLLVRLLSTSPMQWIGARSYSIYLWHWPALWLATAIGGELSTPIALGVVAASLLPAMASFRWIEQPARSAPLLSAKPIRGIVMTGATAVAGYTLGFALLTTTTNLPPVEPTAPAEITTEVAGVQLDAAEIVPSVATARHDIAVGYGDGCIPAVTDPLQDPCTYGNPNSETTLLLIGNSHAGHWTPAFFELAERYDWRILTNIRSSCRLPLELTEDLCEDWATDTVNGLSSVVEEEGVDLVVVMTRSVTDDPHTDAEVEHLYEEVFEVFATIDTNVAVMRPTPEGKVIGIDCPSLLVADLGECATPVAEATEGGAPITRAAHDAGLPVIDMTNYICNETLCPPVIDDLLVRRDRHHLTSTFSEALATPLGEQLERAVPELFASTG